MTHAGLYNYIINDYGIRGAYITDIANELKLTKKEARFLTQACGYHRTKRTAPVPLSQFCTDSDVVRILAKINSSCNSKTSY